MISSSAPQPQPQLLHTSPPLYPILSVDFIVEVVTMQKGFDIASA